MNTLKCKECHTPTHADFCVDSLCRDCRTEARYIGGWLVVVCFILAYVGYEAMKLCKGVL